jgi:serpin B
MKKLLSLVIILSALTTHAADNTAATAINSLGIDLLRQTKPNENTVLSPYSIQSAMAMAYEGADGTTRTEMAKVLHYPDGDAIRTSLNALRESLHQLSTNSQAREQREKRDSGAANDPFVLTTANRLFGQKGYDFRPAYQSLLKDSYGAPFEALDFHNAIGAAQHINSWIEQQTHNRIRDLIAPSALNDLTRLVLVNAVYLKVPWMTPFEASATKPQPFHLSGGKDIQVPTMTQKKNFAYGKFNNMTAIVLPYRPYDLQFVVLLPDARDGLEALQQNLTPDVLAKCASLERKEIILQMPTFRLEPPVFSLKEKFETLGMKQAFDIPAGSANFERIASKRNNDYLYISDIFHKTFVDVDEKGTEAAAATAIVMMTNGLQLEKPEAIEVHIDHPFLFAIQHRETGACLFLGRVTDPSKN